MSPPPDDGKLIIETLLRIERNLGGIDERQRNMDMKLAGFAVSLEEHMKDDQERLSSLERFRAQIRALVAAGGTGAGIIGGVAAYFADKWFKGT